MLIKFGDFEVKIMYKLCIINYNYWNIIIKNKKLYL